MTRQNIRDWIITSFRPLTLAVPAETIDQVVDASILYWNTHSAYGVVRMYDTTGGSTTAAVQLDPDIKTVVQCYPSALEEYLFQNHPMWVMLGFITLDRYTQDLMLLSHAFDGYKIYLGNDFRWKWSRSNDSTRGGWLFLQQVPAEAAKVGVVGTKRVLPTEDIADEFVYGWIREYARSGVKMFEGAVKRQATMIDIANDGNEMIAEGKEERTVLEEKLRQESLWVLPMMRK